LPDRDIVPGQPVVAGCPFLLSARERQALSLAADGQTDIEAARAMRVAPRTLRQYLQRARGKLSAINTTHAVAIAVKSNLI